MGACERARCASWFAWLQFTCSQTAICAAGAGGVGRLEAPRNGDCVMPRALRICFGGYEVLINDRLIAGPATSKPG